MQRVRFRELKPYSLGCIAEKLGVDNGQARETIEKLLARGIMCRRGMRAVELEAEEDEPANADEIWQFCYVGIALIDDDVITVYPKYFRNREPNGAEIRQILRVIRSLPKTMQIAALSDDGEKSSDQLSIMLELLERYNEYGIYTNYIDKREINGAGVIDWNRTINQHLPILVEGGPVYIEYETRKTERDESDFITRLHRAVLTECSRRFHEWGIADLLALDEVWLSDSEVDEFGDADLLAWRINRERGVQFVTWKQGILDLLECYVTKRGSEVEFNDVECLGTTSFYHVWELACKVAFGDKLNENLYKLGLRLHKPWTSVKNKKLLEIIPSPRWERFNEAGFFAECASVDTFIPDIITLCESDSCAAVFCIYDAKYYAPSVAKTMQRQPGVESIAKQFMYQAAYRNFIIAHQFKEVVNAFLVPIPDADVSLLARVAMPNIMPNEESPFSNFVYMWGLPASDVFSAYLEGKRVDDGEFRKVWDKHEFKFC